MVEMTHSTISKAFHSFLFLDLSKSVNDLLRFRTKILLREAARVQAPLSSSSEPVEVQ